MFIKLAIFGLSILALCVLDAVFDRVIIRIDFSSIPWSKKFAHDVMQTLGGVVLAAIIFALFF